MQKLHRSGYPFLFVALVFLLAGVAAERPAVYIVLGIVFLILAFGTRRKYTKDVKDHESSDEPR